ncbi:uncharacterized protein LOC139907758 [Centroberyx gerrardi]
MEDRSSTHTFPNLHHHHRHRPSLHLNIPSLQSPELGYPSSQPPLDALEPYGGRGEQPTTSFPTSSASSGGSRESGGGDRGGMDGDAGVGGHLGGERVLGGHFADPWYGAGIKEDVWDDGESCESAVDDFYGKGGCYGNVNDVFYTRNCSSEDGRDGVNSFAVVGRNARVKANYNSYAHLSCEAKNEPVYNREANVSHFNKQNILYNRGAAVSFGDSSVDDGHSRVNDSYLGVEEDFGSSRSSGEDPPPPAELEPGTWVNLSPPCQTPEAGEARWRGDADSRTLASGCQPQRSPIGVNSGNYTQKLDSFSEAFLSHRKRGFPVIPGGDSFGRIWEFGVGKVESQMKSRHSCAFDLRPDSYRRLSSSPPPHPPLPSLPSPPPPFHLMSSVLSPPPTPLPPPSLSPPKMDSPGAFGGIGHSSSKGGESLGTLQFFPPRLQSLPSVHPSGMIWKFPVLSHCFPQPAGDASSIEGNLRPSHCSDYSNVAAQHNVLQTPESSFLTSSSHRPSLHPSTPLCPSSSPSLHPSFHLPPRPSHISSPHYEAGEKLAPYMVSQEVKNGPVSQSHVKQGAPPIYTGTPFPSMLHSSRGQRRGHYTPRPVLNPVRRGPGLCSSLSSLHHRQEGMARGEEEEKECSVLPCINVGRDFQAELPPCFLEWEESGAWSSEDGSPREQLLWKPWGQLEESTNSQDRVERLLSMSSSSCLPGGGSNTELALHCLHSCQGDIMATLEMLLFSQPSPTGDYHYSGSDVWTDSERNLFSAALVTCGKDFSLIQKMVRTKTVCQCVEFYYLSKKLLDKQKKQRKEEEDRDGGMEQQTNVAPIPQPMNRQFGLEGAVAVPPLASFFPCKLCGKMFYKIKSRNAHMKIHRQPQEDWSDRRLQHQLLTQRLALSLPANHTPSPGSNLPQPQAQAPAPAFSSSGLPVPPSNDTDNVLNSVSVTHSNSVTHSDASILDHAAAVTYSNVNNPNPHVITNVDGGDSNQRGPAAVVSFHQSWSSFGLGPDPATFYCDPEVKEAVGVATGGGKGPISWQ